MKVETVVDDVLSNVTTRIYSHLMRSLKIDDAGGGINCHPFL